MAQWELKSGELTIARFDGDHGDYRLLIGEAVTTEGPRNLGSYVWMKVENWPLWELSLIHIYSKYDRRVACAPIANGKSHFEI